MVSSKSLFLAQLLAHFGFLAAIFFSNFQQWMISLLIYFFTGCVGMTMTYHRLLAHRSWSPPKFIEYFGAFIATFGLTGSAISWIAIHRKHHRYADSEKDPHSPRHKGFLYCQWFSMFEPVEIKYATDLIRMPFYQFQHKYYFVICLAYTTFLYFLDPYSIVYAFLAPACILWNAGSSIITISHMGGARTHCISSRAGNNWWLGLLVWGEGWHNNHHNSPSSPYFFEKPYQIDIGGYLIFLINKLYRGVKHSSFKSQ